MWKNHYFARILVQGVKLVQTVVYKMWVSNKTTDLVSNHDWVGNKNKIMNGKVHFENINLILGGIQEPKKEWLVKLYVEWWVQLHLKDDRGNVN